MNTCIERSRRPPAGFLPTPIRVPCRHRLAKTTQGPCLSPRHLVPGTVKRVPGGGYSKRIILMYRAHTALLLPTENTPLRASVSLIVNLKYEHSPNLLAALGREEQTPTGQTVPSSPWDFLIVQM